VPTYYWRSQPVDEAVHSEKEDVVKFKTTVGLASFAFFVFSLLTASAALSESMDCSRTKIRKAELSSHTINPGDRPDRELVLQTSVDICTSDNPEFDGIEETVYVHLDHIGATGVHSGYTKIPVNSGETLWVKFEGTHKLVTQGDTWKLPYHGVFRFIAGTGKYKAIRGGGTYDGFVDENGKDETLNCSAEY
jgi:hypothetical protein